MGMHQMLVGAGGAEEQGTASNPYTSWTELNAAGFTNVTKYLSLGGHTYNVQIDDGGYAKFTLNDNTYTRVYWGNSINAMCGSGQAKCNDINSWTVGTSPAPLWYANSSPYNDFVDWAWADASGTVINHAFFTAFAGQMTSGYRSNSWWHGHNDVEAGSCWHIRYSDGTTSTHDRQANHGGGNLTIMADDFSSTWSGWMNNNKVITAMKNSMADDPAGSIHTWRHSGMCIK